MTDAAWTSIIPERRYDFVSDADDFDLDAAKVALKERAAADGYELGVFGNPTDDYDIDRDARLVRLTFTAGREAA